MSSAPSDSDEHYYIEGYSCEDDPCVDDNGVLVNRLGLTTTAELTVAEAHYVAIRDTTLRTTLLPPPSFDLQGLQAIHRHLFQDIYPWAGDLRIVDIAKGESYFLPHGKIRDEAAIVFTQLATENDLRGLDDLEFAQRAGYFLGRINRIHPFREGNGRTQRAFLRLLAYQAGYLIDFSGCSAQSMVAACQHDRLENDPGPLVRIIRVGLSRLE